MGLRRRRGTNPAAPESGELPARIDYPPSFHAFGVATNEPTPTFVTLVLTCKHRIGWGRLILTDRLLAAGVGGAAAGLEDPLLAVRELTINNRTVIAGGGANPSVGTQIGQFPGHLFSPRSVYNPPIWWGLSPTDTATLRIIADGVVGATCWPVAGVQLIGGDLRTGPVDNFTSPREVR